MFAEKCSAWHRFRHDVARVILPQGSNHANFLIVRRGVWNRARDE